MKRHPHPLFRHALSILALGAATFLFLPGARAQVPAAKEPAFGDRQVFQELRTGLNNRKVNDPNKATADENKKAVGEMAKWMAYRLNVSPYDGLGDDPDYAKKEPMPTDDKPITRLMREALNSMLIPPAVKGPSEDQQAFINEYGKALEKELVLVLKNASKPIVRVNAARMLAQTARMPYVGIADAFVNLLKDDKELDGVKLYACEGIREVLQHNDKTEPKKSAIIDPQKLASIANALIAHIEKTDPRAATDPEAAKVVQFTRREAIRALGAFRESVVRDPKKTALAVPALPLLRIAMCDPKVVPQPSLSEQVEALIGFCSMRIDPDMDVGAAVWGVHVAVVDLIRKQNVDPDNPGRERTLPWKVAGARLTQAMERWKANAEEIPVAQDPKLINDYARVITDAALSKLEEGGLQARPDAPTLAQVKSQLEKKNRKLFKSDPKSSLEPVAPEAPPMKK